MEQTKVTAAYQKLLPVWRAVDLGEVERLETARMQRSKEITSEVDFLKILGYWPATNRHGMDGHPFEFPNCVVQLKTMSPLFRAVEDLVIENLTSAVIVYWATRSAAALLPNGATFPRLLKQTSCVSVFSEDDDAMTAEWCFLVERCFGEVYCACFHKVAYKFAQQPLPLHGRRQLLKGHCRFVEFSLKRTSVCLAEVPILDINAIMAK
jgi:hypothetical protein